MIRIKRIISHTKIPGYLLLAVLYFFFNNLFLPEGLLYTAILTPFLLWWLHKQKSLHRIWYFFIFTLPFIPIHLFYGIEIWYYFRSYIMLFTAVVFGITFYVFLKKKEDMDFIFRKILLLNFIFMLLALLILPIPSVKAVFWYLKEFSPGVENIPRLKLLTYEASYYSLLFVPIAIYFYLRLCLLENKRPWFIFIMVTGPLLLSLSFGVIAGLILTFICLFTYNPILFLHRKATIRFIACGTALVLVCLAGLLIFDPHNPLFGRVRNIFTGKDTSFRGRTYEAFILAWKIVKEKNIFFGCGPGQVKIVGVEVFQNYYGYLPPVVRIPNTLADTMATYGLVGLFARLALSIYLFFKAKVAHNYYQLALFIFIFIYQFTGSFLTNIVEYVIWILAFTPVFKSFDRKVIFENIYPIKQRIFTTKEYLAYENSDHGDTWDT